MHELTVRGEQSLDFREGIESGESFLELVAKDPGLRYQMRAVLGSYDIQQ